MADFRTRRIRLKPPLKPFKKLKDGLIFCLSALSKTNKKQWSYALGFLSILIAIFIVIKVSVGIYAFIRDFNPKDMVFALGSDLKQDQNGYTNIALLGDGGHVRDGADLVDTIMVASIDFKDKSVSLLSVPRDFYVKSDKYGNAKINELYRDNKKQFGDVDTYLLYEEVLGDIANLDIQYYLRVDFSAFVDVIDSIGGITVDVKEPIYDPYYPNDTDDGYTVFEMDAGLQNMNGETALKFARSRKTTSDFDRAIRQQQVLMAIREKAMSGEVLSSPKTIGKLYNSVSSNINTNLTLREMIALASFGKDFDKNRVVNKILHDDPSREGGFLYTPERKYYNGQFVLVPDGDNYDLIHKYANLIFHNRDILMNPVKIEVLNATKQEGVAREVASQLNRYGFNIENIDNLLGKDGKKKLVEKSFIRYNSWDVSDDGTVTAHHRATLDALAQFINGEAIPNDEQKPEGVGADISIVLGSDYKLL
jgi:LCP family protein required for cell wall assembly